MTEFDILNKIFYNFVNFGDTEKCLSNYEMGNQSDNNDTGNALERVQRVHEPTDIWDITFCTR